MCWSRVLFLKITIHNLEYNKLYLYIKQFSFWNVTLNISWIDF